MLRPAAWIDAMADARRTHASPKRGTSPSDTAVFLPLSFVVGFFGQNFGWMTSHVNAFGAFVGFGAGGLLLPCLVLLAFLRLRRYI